MTKEEKQLLLTDLCARLPYKVICTASVRSNNTDTPSIPSNYCLTHSLLNYVWIDCYKLRPYLRPMSSMTEEECEYYDGIRRYLVRDDWEVVDWLNAHHFDYRGLIPMGLALEAQEGMYNAKTE